VQLNPASLTLDFTKSNLQKEVITEQRKETNHDQLKNPICFVTCVFTSG